jgi:hypothetical protein
MSDGLDLSTVEIHNSHDVRGWPATATITRIEFRPRGVHVEHTKNVGPGAWPNFRPPEWDGDLQYTLWIFLHIGGRWHGMGGIQFWQACDQNGGPPEEFAQNWYYAADRWAPMTGYQPQPGERVGFMVSAGDARNSGVESVHERSNLVALPFPSSGDVYTAPAIEEPATPEPATPGPAPAVPSPEPATPPAIAAWVQSIDDRLRALQETTATKEDLRALRQEAVDWGKAFAAGMGSTGSPASVLKGLFGRR